MLNFKVTLFVFNEIIFEIHLFINLSVLSIQGFLLAIYLFIYILHIYLLISDGIRMKTKTLNWIFYFIAQGFLMIHK